MARRNDGPLLVFGPRSLEYDFGPAHPLSPRRFGPGIELLRAVGAEPGLAPEPAADAELEWLHSPAYIATVRRFSASPNEPAEAGIGPGDDPAFRGMHEAAATVAGGSIGAMEAILRGDVEHAYQPGGGLHHAMRARASGFCIYNDVALAIARARREGLRVLYVDLDVHHGDGVQALHYADPGVLTVSFHETGAALFPGTGFVDELGEGTAAATSVNVPFEPMTGPDAWLAGVRALVPALAAAFGPDVVVSQHGADGHVWDPLAHLSLTTTVMGEAARLVDRVAHRHASGRWLATGGGGYSIYRVVPRAWALTWLAGAHRDVPAELPAEWRERWSGDAARWADDPLPDGFEDAVGLPSPRSLSPAAAAESARTVELVRVLTVPALLRAAQDRRWWTADGRPGAGVQPAAGSPDPAVDPTIVVPLTLEALDRLALAPRTIPPADPGDGMAILRAALRDGAVAAGAVAGEWLVGVALAAPEAGTAPEAATRAQGRAQTPIAETELDRLLALGVAPEWRRRGLATSLLRALAAEQDRRRRGLAVLHTAAERDPFEPLARDVRRRIADRLLGEGFESRRPPAEVAAADPSAVAALRPPRR